MSRVKVASTTLMSRVPLKGRGFVVRPSFDSNSQIRCTLPAGFPLCSMLNHSSILPHSDYTFIVAVPTRSEQITSSSKILRTRSSPWYLTSISNVSFHTGVLPAPWMAFVLKSYCRYLTVAKGSILFSNISVSLLSYASFTVSLSFPVDGVSSF